MRDTYGCRVVDVADGELRLHDGSTYAHPRRGLDYCGKVEVTTISESDVPDLDDPATLGCLLALVREAWGDPSMYAQDRGPDGWWVWQSPANAGTVARHWPSEAEALIAALEAAP